MYQVFGNTGEKFNVEWFATAIRIYHLAYLKAHYRTVFDSILCVILNPDGSVYSVSNRWNAESRNPSAIFSDIPEILQNLKSTK